MASANPLLTLERMLNGKTTLKTQKTTHNNIICIGTELLNELRKVMEEDKDKAIKEALAEAEARALAERMQALEELREKMNDEREQALEEARMKAEEQMAEIKYRCEVAEKKRARLAWEKYMKEKADALADAARKAEEEKQDALKELTESLTRKLRNEAALEREKAVGEALSIARKKFERKLKETIDKTTAECNAMAEAEAKRVARIHKNQVEGLNQRINQLNEILDTERDSAKKLHETHIALKEDYKRFQNITRGYHSDFLLR
ncbi:stress response protein nst1-like [Actinia tenebrosa]|uniref:Stress response protein nst1-like n=1 Tax=Actinia tenebrosa TaxID=6105 RepID=A0A6P8HKY4_ACTTE|nr:stress response protein nst1-like [Actinia tenebrosa]